MQSFDSEPNEDSPYYRLNSRKFTLVPTGGFDGWDIYRESRTNGDTFILGNNGYLRGAAPSVDSQVQQDGERLNNCWSR